jgi:hypothetical protein
MLQRSSSIWADQPVRQSKKHRKRKQFRRGERRAVLQAVTGASLLLGHSIRPTNQVRAADLVGVSPAYLNAAVAVLKAEDAGLLHSVLSGNTPSYVKVGEWKQYLGFSDPAMTRVAKFEKADETIPVCIIGLEPQFTTPKANIARFDFGVCMAAFDGQQTIRADEFDQDVEAQTFTLCRADNLEQYAYSLSRFKKITAARYKGWSLVIPGEFEELTKEHTFQSFWYREFVKGFDGESVLKPKERVAAHQ